MYGPNGLGICMLKKWVDELPPYQGGGGMISEVKNDITYAESQQNLRQEPCRLQR